MNKKADKNGATVEIKIRSTFAVGWTGDSGEGSDADNALLLNVKQGTDIKSLLKTFPSLGPSESYDDLMIHVFVNGGLKGFDYVLQSGDVLDVHIPVSGG